MFLSKRDAYIRAISRGIGYCLGKIDDDDYDNVIQSSYPKVNYDERIELLNKIKNLRAVHVSDDVDLNLLESKSWFHETVQADKSCAVLYSESTEDAAVVLFYDRECNFYVVDYLVDTNVPFGALVKDMLASNTICIAYANEIPNKYSKVIILQGKDD